MNVNTIPNSLVLGVVGAFYAYALYAGLPHSVVATNTAIAFATLVVFALLLRGQAGGVVKLTAAVVLWLGFEYGMVFVVVSMLSLAAFGYGSRLLGYESADLPAMPFQVATLALMAAMGWLPPTLFI